MLEVPGVARLTAEECKFLGAADASLVSLSGEREVAYTGSSGSGEFQQGRSPIAFATPIEGAVVFDVAISAGLGASATVTDMTIQLNSKSAPGVACGFAATAVVYKG